MPWTRALALWLLLMAVEVLHGTLRVLWIVPWLGDLRARQIGVVVGSALILLVTTALAGWLRPWRTRTLLGVGTLWMGLTLAFEVALGRALGYPWSRIAADYDPRRGGLMTLGLAVLLLSPWLAARARSAGRGSAP